MVVLRSLMLAASVFVAAALTGAHLAEAEPARSNPSSPCPAGCGWYATGPEHEAGEQVSDEFALSLIYSGSGALAISVLGLVIVGRRRRHW